jgi:hypothetical protein
MTETKRTVGVEPSLGPPFPGFPPPYIIPLKNGAGEVTAYTLVDEDDREQVQAHRWYVGNHGYAMRYSSSDRASILLHRVLAEAKPGEVVDHINRDQLDNRRSNLRITDRRGNAHNSTKVTARSGYRNVYPWGKRWVARFQEDGEFITVGSFDTPEEANAAAIEYRRVNYPTSPEAMTTWPLLTAANAWGTHFLRCFFCCIGDRYTQDRFCETGRELIVAMLDELDGRP